MTTVELKVDLSELKEYIYELGDLWRCGVGLPNHVVELAKELGQEESPPGFLNVESDNGMLYVSPGPKLNVLMALLRVHRA